MIALVFWIGFAMAISYVVVSIGFTIDRRRGHSPLVEPSPDAFPLPYESPYLPPQEELIPLDLRLISCGTKTLASCSCRGCQKWRKELRERGVPLEGYQPTQPPRYSSPPQSPSAIFTLSQVQAMKAREPEPKYDVIEVDYPE